MAHAGKVGGLALAEAVENLNDNAVQAVRSLALGHSGLAGQLFCNLVLLHCDYNLSAAKYETTPSKAGTRLASGSELRLCETKIFLMLL
jgi:hypothetical protein